MDALFTATVQDDSIPEWMVQDILHRLQPREIAVFVYYEVKRDGELMEKIIQLLFHYGIQVQLLRVEESVHFRQLFQCFAVRHEVRVEDVEDLG